jgi:hypothetical protein
MAERRRPSVGRAEHHAGPGAEGSQPDEEALESAPPDEEAPESAPPPSPIVELAEMLAGDKLVAWEDVEACLEDFPGWAEYAQRLRYPSLTSNNRMVFAGDPAQYSYLSAAQARALLRLFGPFAVLLDTRQTPFQRAHRLRELGVDPIEFIEESRHNASPAISEAAGEMLAAAESEGGLLRPVDDPAQAKELLHPAAPSGEEGLLHPSEEGSATAERAAATKRPSWLQRLFGRREKPER